MVNFIFIFDYNHIDNLINFSETPKDYQPAAFETVKENPLSENWKKKNLNYIKLGHLNTGYHTLRCLGNGKMVNSTSIGSSTKS